MHLGYEIQQSVVFIGHSDTNSPIGFTASGTGFLVSNGGAGYLVTARHVAEPLDGTPFAIRVNKTNEAMILEADQVKWTFHPDEAVDLAAIPLHLSGEAGYEARYQRTDATFLDESWFAEKRIGPGDNCYTVGLFKFLHGSKKNLPMVHTGHVALVPPPGEKIPVWDKTTKTMQLIEGYLIESHAIDGASGSPVVIRRTISQDGVQLEGGGRVMVSWSEAKVYLLGLFSGAWFLPPDATIKTTISAVATNVVPVGIGVVIPASKIVELLEVGALGDFRKRRDAMMAAQQTALPGAEQEPPTKADNPSHREDFMSLVSAAAKTRTPDGET